MSSLDFLKQQNERLAFYNQDFWQVAKFFSTLILALLSAPFVVWAQESRPQNWALITSASPILGTLTAAIVAYVLKRTAISYYEVGATFADIFRSTSWICCSVALAAATP
jgi:hypothetical protein